MSSERGEPPPIVHGRRESTTTAVRAYGASVFLGMIFLFGGAPAWTESAPWLEAPPVVLTWHPSKDDAFAALTIARTGVIDPRKRSSVEHWLEANREALGGIVSLSRLPELPRLAKAPWATSCHEAGIALAARGILSEADGRIDAAVEDWLAAIRLGQMIHGGAASRPCLAMALVSRGVEKWAIVAAARSIERGHVTASQAQRILATLDLRSREKMPRLEQAARNDASDLHEQLSSRRPETVDLWWRQLGLPADTPPRVKAQVLAAVAPKLDAWFRGQLEAALRGVSLEEQALQKAIAYETSKNTDQVSLIVNAEESVARLRELSGEIVKSKRSGN